MPTSHAIDENPSLAANVSALRKRQAFLRFNLLIEYTTLVAALLCVTMLAFGSFDQEVIDLLLLGAGAASVTLLVVSWYHQWYYRSHTELLLRKITDYIIEKRKENPVENSYERIKGTQVIEDFTRVQQASIKCSTPLSISVRKVVVITWTLLLFSVLISITTMAVRYGILGWPE